MLTYLLFLLDRFPSPYSLADAEFFINLKINEEPVTNFAIEIDNEVCGVIGVDLRNDVYRKTPLLGYWLGEQYWNRGVITEAIKLVTDYAFNSLDIICIQACVLDKNQASMRALEKAGYMRQGVLKQSLIKNDHVCDEYIYATYRK